MALYGHAWASAHGVSAVNSATDRLTIDGETWQRALAGVTGQQFAAGLDACIALGDEFPPSAPRFRAMCLGVPSLAEVKLALSRSGAKPPFVVLVMQHLDWHNWKQADQRTADRMLGDAYAVAREHVMLGGELPVAVAAIKSPEKYVPVVATPEVAQPYRDAISKELGIPAGKEAAAGPDA